MFRSKKIIFTFLFFITVVSLQAQNKSFDWGIGIHGSLYSYAAMVENKVTSPYKYNRGSQLSVSRYLNHNFDAELMLGRTTTMYYTGNFNGEMMYDTTSLYDGSVSLKYKLDNGYIIKHENFVVSPYLKVGLGSNYVGYRGKADLMVPAGFGMSVGMGKYMSFVYETNFRYSVGAGNTYAAHSVGLKASLGKASKSRIVATRKRERARKLARIEKYKSKKDKTQLASVFNDNDDRGEDQVTTSLNDEMGDEPPAPIIEEPVVEEPVKTSLNDEAAETEIFSAPRPIFEKPKEEATSTETKIEKEIPTEYNTVIEEIPVESTAATPVVEKVEKVDEKEDDYCTSSADILTGYGKEISFDVNSYRIRSRMHSALSNVVETMERCAGTNFSIIAHTDSDGDVAYNNKLAKKRAEAVKDYLISQGIDASRLTTLAYGEYMADDENSSTDKAANRRISFKVNRSSF